MSRYSNSTFFLSPFSIGVKTLQKRICFSERFLSFQGRPFLGRFFAWVANRVMENTELNDLRIIICLKKSDVTVERISVCNVTEKLMEHSIHCLPCSNTNDVIDLLPL